MGVERMRIISCSQLWTIIILGFLTVADDDDTGRQQETRTPQGRSMVRRERLRWDTSSGTGSHFRDARQPSRG